MKKIVLLLTVVAMILGMFSVNIAFADTSEDSKYIDFLKKLDIWGSYTSEHFEGQRYMYRGEYIKSILNLISDDQSTGVEFSKTQTDEAFSLGLIADKNNVNASLPIKLEDALKVSVNAMGYSPLAEQYGGYPHGHMKVANKLDLLDGIHAKMGDYLTREEAAQLIYNTALGSPFITYSYTNEGLSYAEAYGKVSMLEYYRDIVEISGIVTATPLSNIYSENGLGKGSIRIEDKTYKTLLDNADKFIGMYVNAFVIKEGSLNGEVLHIEEDNPEDILKINSEDIKTVSNDLHSLSYIDKNHKKKTVDINPGVAILYNGVLYEDCTSADFMRAGGFVGLIDNEKSTKGYDVVKIWVSKNILASSVSSEGNLIQNLMTYDTTLGTLKLDEDKSLIMHNGKSISISEIKQFDLLEVFVPKTQNSDYVQINVNRDDISGSVELLSNNRIILNGTTYEFSPNYTIASANSEKYAPKMQAGKVYRIFIDSYGRICAADGDDEGIVYALITGADYDNSGFNETAFIRVLTFEDKWVEYPVSEKLCVNDSPCKLSDLETTLGNSVQMLKLEVDGKGEVRNIWTATETTDIGKDGFTVKPEQQDNFYSGNNSFKDNVYVSANPKIFVKYTNPLLTGKDEEDYFVTNLSFLKHTYQYTFRAYNIDEYNCSELFYIELPDTYDVVLKQETYGFIVESVRETTDSDGNDITKLYGGYGSSGLMQLPVIGNAAAGIKSGDFILPVIDPQGNMKAYTKVYSLSDGEVLRYPTTCYERDGWVQGEINKLDIANLRCLVGSQNKPYRWTSATVPVYIYQKNSGTVVKTNISDIEIGDYVILHYLRATLREIIIIR